MQNEKKLGEYIDLFVAGSRVYLRRIVNISLLARSKLGLIDLDLDRENTR